SLTDNPSVLSSILLAGNIIILNTVTSLSSLGILLIISLSTFGFGYLIHKYQEARRLLPTFIIILVTLFILKNFHLTGLALVERIGLSYILFRLIHFLIDSGKDKISSYDLLAFCNYI